MANNGIRPEWEKLLDQGWLFDYDSKERRFWVVHPNGQTTCLANFTWWSDQTLIHQIGYTLMHLLNDRTNTHLHEVARFRDKVLLNNSLRSDQAGMVVDMIEKHWPYLGCEDTGH